MNFFNLWFYILLIIIIEGKNGQTKDNINISIKNELKNEINNNSKIQEKKINKKESTINHYSNSTIEINEEDKMKKDDESNKTISEKEQFDKQIEHFTVGDFTTMEIKPKILESIYYKVEKNCTIKFAFYLSDIEKNIDIKITGPDEKGIIKEYQILRKKNFLYYEFKADFPGKYIFYLDNKDNSGPLEISFALKDNLKGDGNIRTRKLDKISDLLDNIDNKINKMRLKQNMINKKVEVHNDSINKHNKQILIYSIVEVGIMVFIFMAQLLYIKGKIDKV